MHALNQLVQQGKVLYLGVSDTPAWVVSKANECRSYYEEYVQVILTLLDARNHGMRQFSVYQGKWNASTRDLERDIIPMCREEGMAIAPWASLGGGNFKTKEQRESQEGRKSFGASETDLAVSAVLEKIAARKGTIMTSVVGPPLIS